MKLPRSHRAPLEVALLNLRNPVPRLARTLAGLLLCSLSLFATAQTSTTIIGVAETTPTFSTLLNALETAGLTATLEEAGPYTVFAPTNDAFAKLSEADLSALLADPEALKRLLDYHIVPGSYTTSEITSSLRETGFTTLLGATLPITESGVGDATVTTVNIPASNGVLYAIDTVLTPPAEAVTEAPDTETPGTETPETEPPGTETPEPPQTTTSADGTRTRFEVASAGSGVSGSALITALTGERAIVTLTLTGTLPGGEYPAALYAGDCDALSATPLADLEPYLNDVGFSTTVVNLPYATLIGEPHAVAVQASPGDPSVLACGEVGQ